MGVRDREEREYHRPRGKEVGRVERSKVRLDDAGTAYGDGVGEGRTDGVGRKEFGLGCGEEGANGEGDEGDGMEVVRWTGQVKVVPPETSGVSVRWMGPVGATKEL